MSKSAAIRLIADPASARSRARLTLASRFEEAAQPLRDVTFLKAGLGLIAGGSGLLALSWPTCLAWTAGMLLIEAWVWLALAPRPDGRARSRAGWINFTAAYVVMNVWWLLLGFLFWSAGTPVAQAAGAAIMLVVVAVAVLLFHNTPVVFLAAGAAPAIGAMAVLLAAEGRDLRETALVWIALALGGFFCLGRAIDTPSVQEQQRRVNESLENYETLAANVTDVICRTALTGEFEYVSPAVLAILGYAPEELVGTSRWAITDPEVDRAAMGEALQRMLADPGRAEVMTVRVRHKDGRWIWLQSSGRLIIENDVPVATIDASRDVTAQVAADAALQEAKAEAEAATRAKAEFVANVSHEIRTPMNGVLGALQLLDQEDISPEGRELMRQAADSGRMLSQLLNDVLDFSKIEPGSLTWRPSPWTPVKPSPAWSACWTARPALRASICAARSRATTSGSKPTRSAFVRPCSTSSATR